MGAITVAHGGTIRMIDRICARTRQQATTGKRGADHVLVDRPAGS